MLVYNLVGVGLWLRSDVAVRGRRLLILLVPVVGYSRGQSGLIAADRQSMLLGNSTSIGARSGTELLIKGHIDRIFPRHLLNILGQLGGEQGAKSELLAAVVLPLSALSVSVAR